MPATLDKILDAKNVPGNGVVVSAIFVDLGQKRQAILSDLPNDNDGILSALSKRADELFQEGVPFDDAPVSLIGLNDVRKIDFSQLKTDVASSNSILDLKAQVAILINAIEALKEKGS